MISILVYGHDGLFSPLSFLDQRPTGQPHGDEGRRAVQKLLRRGRDVGLVPDVAEIDFIG